MSFKTKQLRSAYEELIDVLGLVDKKKKPVQIPEDADNDYLMEKIEEAFQLVDPATDEFTDETQEVLDSLVEAEPEEAEPEEAEEKPVKSKAKTEKKGPIKKAGEPGKPGIIASIVEIIEASGKKGVTKDAILKELIDRFPERNEQSMKSTINVQVPARINKEKFPIEKLEGGLYRKA